MKLPKSWTTVTTLSKILALTMFVALPFIGFYLGKKYQENITILKDISEDKISLQKSDELDTEIANIKLEILNNQFVINDGNVTRSVVQIVEGRLFTEGQNNKLSKNNLYLTRLSTVGEGTPNCTEAVYLQKNNGELKKIVEDDGCEYTLIYEIGFFDAYDLSDFFFVKYGGNGGGATVIYDLEGNEIELIDEKKLLEGWVVGEINEIGSGRATIHLWKNLGADNAIVEVDIKKMKIISETFKLE